MHFGVGRVEGEAMSSGASGDNLGPHPVAMVEGREQPALCRTHWEQLGG